MADFNTAVALTIKHEGGFVDNPVDPGQATNMGITQVDMPGQDMRTLTVAQAVAYYRENYWKPLYSQIASQDIASKLFDLGVLFGVGAAVKNLQACIDAKADGTFGPVSLNMLNAADPKLTLFKFKTDMKALAHDIAAKKPQEAVFLSGWLNRIDS